MKRVSDEGGVDAGARNVGRFFLAAIPLVLGLAASVWFGLWITGYTFQKQREADRHELSQQERSAVYVGATERPKGKLAVEMLPKTCFKIVRADLDTKKKSYSRTSIDYQYSMILYGQNTCGEALSYASWHWQMVAPNGTLISEGYHNSCPIPNPSEISECIFEIEPDERAEKFRVWGQPRP